MPSLSILAEPPVAVVDKVVDKRGTRAVAQAYLEFLYTPEGQEIAAKHYYRPRDRERRRRVREPVPEARAVHRSTSCSAAGRRRRRRTSTTAACSTRSTSREVAASALPSANVAACCPGSGCRWAITRRLPRRCSCSSRSPTLVLKTGALGWRAVLARRSRAPRALAAYRLSFGASLRRRARSTSSSALLVAWVLVRYRFPGRRIVDALVDLPFALPTAVGGHRAHRRLRAERLDRRSTSSRSASRSRSRRSASWSR